VVSIERHPGLSEGGGRVLGSLGVKNVELAVGDGTLGVPDRAPFDAIAVHATAPAPPETLLAQLAEGGRLVVPLAAEDADVLTLYRRRGDRHEAEPISPCRFVPLIGEEGFEE
jgi:protein-L-isoaspartate(D-aspartate) O-methyltransferase